MLKAVATRFLKLHFAPRFPLWLCHSGICMRMKKWRKIKKEGSTPKNWEHFLVCTQTHPNTDRTFDKTCTKPLSAGFWRREEAGWVQMRVRPYIRRAIPSGSRWWIPGSPARPGWTWGRCCSRSCCCSRCCSWTAGGWNWTSTLGGRCCWCYGCTLEIKHISQHLRGLNLPPA